ncbi:MAG TPA: primosomal protein N' [Phototrophicaceae bacterium]|nr:primosomal protein N' [Phototrophicaceae bacterium]
MKSPRQFARVVVPGPFKEPLIYSVPESLQGRIVPGLRVVVPLQKRTVTGILLESVFENSLHQTKDIIEFLDDQPFVDAHLLKLAKWISQYYLASLGEVIGSMLPPNARRQSQRIVILKLPEVRVTDELGRKILEKLRQHKRKMPSAALKRAFPEAALQTLLARFESRGIIEIKDHLPTQRTRKDQSWTTANDPQTDAPAKFRLTIEQNNALRAIENRINSGGFESFLLHGVTGSGKTEVYLRAMERIKALGRRSLILIPEISLTAQLLDRVRARFPNKTGVLHSALTAAERLAQWRHIVRGNVDVVIGARSAVFAPIPDLGLIVVDEEHDSSYKQEESLRYNGRDVAVVRGKLLGCPVILGSATPALETYENCRQGRYQLLEITQRVEQRPLPTIEAIDLRASNASNSGAMTTVPPESVLGGRRLFSEELVRALKENFYSGHQTLIFLNRRGFANFVQCRACGYVWRCPHCSVTLTSHLKLNRMSCHHCDYRRPLTDNCPECHDNTLSGIGGGTERVEQTLKHLLPDARVARMDRDTTHGRGSHEALIRRWEKGDIDILVGTQMVTKGHDVFGVTVVGALLADLSLNMPDFRAAERTFQLLSQVAGRSGRGDNPGRVIVQTYAPDHYAIQFLMAHDYRGFFAAEREFRQALNYPPFSRLVNVRVDGPKLTDVETKIQFLATELRTLQSRNPEIYHEVEVLGPAAAPIEKLRNRYRWQLLLRSKQSSRVLKLARAAREILPNSRAVRLHIDVDPYSML